MSYFKTATKEVIDSFKKWRDSICIHKQAVKDLSKSLGLNSYKCYVNKERRGFRLMKANRHKAKKECIYE